MDCFFDHSFSFGLLIRKNIMLLEFRVPLPYCVDNPSIGYLFMNMSACKQATGGGEGVEWIERSEYPV